ncbi:MAG: peptidylprolyl isomerase [Pseudomonadota bacterium]
MATMFTSATVRICSLALTVSLLSVGPAAAQSIGIPLRGETKPKAQPKPQQPAPRAASSRSTRKASPQSQRARSKPYETSLDPFDTVYVVGERAVTGYDIEQRARLIEFGAGRRVENVEEEAIKLLIEDELKIAEAKRRGVTLDETLRTEAFENVLRSNRLSEEAFVSRLKAAGVTRETFNRQLEAGILWGRVLRAEFGDRLEPSDDEISAAMERMEQTDTAKRYEIGQLLAAVGPNAPRAQVVAAGNQAMKAYEAATSCDRLESVAKEFKLGGGKGLLTAEQMPAPLRKEVLSMKVGERTKPMRSRQGFNVFVLCGVRSGVNQASPERVKRSLQQDRIERFSETFLAEVRRETVVERR